MAQRGCLVQIKLTYSSVRIGAKKQDEFSYRIQGFIFSAGVCNFNASVLVTAGTGLLPSAVLAEGWRTKTFEWGGG